MIIHTVRNRSVGGPVASGIADRVGVGFAAFGAITGGIAASAGDLISSSPQLAAIINRLGGTGVLIATFLAAFGAYAGPSSVVQVGVLVVVSVMGGVPVPVVDVVDVIVMGNGMMAAPVAVDVVVVGGVVPAMR